MLLIAYWALRAGWCMNFIVQKSSLREASVMYIRLLEVRNNTANVRQDGEAVRALIGNDKLSENRGPTVRTFFAPSLVCAQSPMGRELFTTQGAIIHLLCTLVEARKRAMLELRVLRKRDHCDRDVTMEP